MKIIKPLLISATILLSSTSFANDNKHEEGEKLFKSVCAVCHGVSVGGMDMSKRIAPPIAGVRKHYLDAYPDEASFVGAITSWIEKQDEGKTLMPGAIRKFKLMPPISVPKADAAKIAAYIYSGNIDIPEGLNKHMGEMHKKDQDHGEEHQGHDEHMEHDMHSKMMHGMDDMKGKNGMGCMKGKGGIGGMRGKGGMKGMMMQLNLAPQQKQQMQELIQEKRAVMQPLKRELQQVKQAIHLLDTTSSDYKKQIFSLADKKSKLVFRMVIEKGEKRMQIESILGPKQRAKFNATRQKRHTRKQAH